MKTVYKLAILQYIKHAIQLTEHASIYFYVLYHRCDVIIIIISSDVVHRQQKQPISFLLV